MRRFADVEQLFGRLGMLAKSRELPLEPGGENLRFVLARLACQRQTKGQRNPLGRRRPAGGHHTLGQHAGGLDKRRLVQQRQGLQGRVGARCGHLQASRPEASKVIIDGGAIVRFQNVYRLRRYSFEP